MDTGDIVKHSPTGERWVVAYVKGEYLAWCGWPEGEARISDCTLIKKASDEQRDKLLREMAAMPNDDARRRYARRRLGTDGIVGAQREWLSSDTRPNKAEGK